MKIQNYSLALIAIATFSLILINGYMVLKEETKAAYEFQDCMQMKLGDNWTDGYIEETAERCL